MTLKSKLVQYIKDLVHKNDILEKWYGITVETKEFYGQFGEDASLQTYFTNRVWSAGGDSKVIPKGFYVDIGGYNPVEISNTHWFHKRGWNGINVDLSSESIEAFKDARPNDVNLVAAISNIKALAEVEYYQFGLSSVYNTLNKESALEIEKTHSIKPLTKKIQAMSLEHLFETYLPEKQEISLLSIDTEGHDLEVLKSNNWDKYRPTASVIELEETNFRELISNEIVLFLEDRGYKMYSWMNPSIVFIAAPPDIPKGKEQ